MRAATDASVAEVYARMTRAQAAQMDKVVRAHHEVERAESTAALRLSTLHAMIFDALAKGIPARIIAEQTRMSTSRIYQIRDHVATHR